MVAMVWYALILAAAPGSGLAVGPCTYYLFQPSVTVETQRESATARLYFPKPHAEPRQKVVRLFDFTDGAEIDALWDKGRQNEFLVLAAEVEPERPATLQYSALIGLHRLELTGEVAGAVGELPRSEQVRLRPFLELTESTGRGRPQFKTSALAALGDEADPVRRARRLYDLVRQRLRYERLEGFKGAGRAWDEALGECCDYAAVFVALCRSAGIPARVVAGFHFENDSWQMHAWAEFHVHNIGWIPCDPSFGDTAGETAADAYFGRLGSEYLALARDCDLLLPGPGARPVGIVQQYVFRYQGPERPKLTWQVAGRCLGERLPDGLHFVEPRSAPMRRGRR